MLSAVSTQAQDARSGSAQQLYETGGHSRFLVEPPPRVVELVSHEAIIYKTRSGRVCMDGKVGPSSTQRRRQISLLSMGSPSHNVAPW